ncbi:MAG: cytochrome P450 [SAR86 cluster bacterium]|uniref:Cytochrome P450 n=1 Tax=SAR86 cluster bacterium TaxID=2030880 RepID=A0A972VX12_9GAMM|nr:cytochrome P450 [SAR86 cluster bacterium]
MWCLSVNRDESVFQDADTLIIDRPNARAHVAFGFGVHRCMGNRLAEMPQRVLWEEIMQRFSTIKLAADAVPFTEQLHPRCQRSAGHSAAQISGFLIDIEALVDSLSVSTRRAG